MMMSQILGLVSLWCLTVASTVSQDAPIRVRNDFNSDGHADIMWQNETTGELQIWFMRGASRIGRQSVLIDNHVSTGRFRAPRWEPTSELFRTPHIGGLNSASWEIVGTADLDKDGKTDLLFHEGSTGQIHGQLLYGHRAQWLMGFSPEAVDGVSSGNAAAGLPWSIVGVSGLSRRQVDIYWHNGSTGEVQAWHTTHRGSYSQVLGRASVLGEDGTAAKVGWPFSIVGMNDFNGDGKADLLWHNASTGESQIWNLNGARVSSRATVTGEDGQASLVKLPWSIVGTDDFNQDRNADILWHNATTGETQVWYLNGARVSARATVVREDGKPEMVGAPWGIVSR